jgi:hypothetical protein
VRCLAVSGQSGLSSSLQHCLLTDVGAVDEAKEVQQADGGHDHQVYLCAEATLGNAVVGGRDIDGSVGQQVLERGFMASTYFSPPSRLPREGEAGETWSLVGLSSPIVGGAATATVE